MKKSVFTSNVNTKYSCIWYNCFTRGDFGFEIPLFIRAVYEFRKSVVTYTSHQIVHKNRHDAESTQG